MQRLLITGGAGFVGSNLALALKREWPKANVLAFDNLKRRGSELTLPRLRDGGVGFIHGDVRQPDDLAAAGAVDLLIEASAEPSVHSGYNGDPTYLLHTNLVGAINCLEAARRHGATFVFLSSSRVYPIQALRALPLERTESRFVLKPDPGVPGVSAAGIGEAFPVVGHRSLYGATKLAGELLVEEYRAMYGLRTVVNRCGVLAGPWQMGKVDQGFIALWLARHFFGGRLDYLGFGGDGLQVRDILHIDDLCDLVIRQCAQFDRHSGRLYNVGGGMEMSVSLRELTRYCQDISKRQVEIGRVAETRAADIPFFVTDSSAVRQAAGWAPRRSIATLLDDTARWLVAHRDRLEAVLSA